MPVFFLADFMKRRPVRAMGGVHLHRLWTGDVARGCFCGGGEDLCAWPPAGTFTWLAAGTSTWPHT